MAYWSEDYAYKQKGGSMDFWTSLRSHQQRLCADIVDGILKANEENGRARINKLT